MHTHRPTSRLRTALAAVVAACGLAGGVATFAAPSTVSAATVITCKTDCINPVDVQRSLGNTRLAFTTTVKAHAKVNVYSSTGVLIRTIEEPDGFTKDHTLTLGDLGDGLSFKYRLRATGTGGATTTEWGTFTSMKRVVTVKITSIKVTDDSDSSGAGEIGAWTTWAGSPASRLWDWQSISSGTTKTLTAGFGLGGRSTMEYLKVMLADDDIDIWDNCKRSTFSLSFGTGSSVCFDYTTAVIPITMTTANGVTGPTPFSFTASGPVDFVVNGTVTVAVT